MYNDDAVSRHNYRKLSSVRLAGFPDQLERQFCASPTQTCCSANPHGELYGGANLDASEFSQYERHNLTSILATKV